MDMGFDAEGIDVLEHCEWDRAAVETLRRNWPSQVRECDAAEYAPRVRNVELVFGGPPCQPFSRAGKRMGCEDPRDRFFLAHKWARTIRPRLFVLETVANVFSDSFADWREWWWDQMDERGYRGVMWSILSADYGTPQLRPRVFFVAWRKGEKRMAKVLAEPPPRTHAHPDEAEGLGLPVWTTAMERLIGGCCGRYGLYTCWALNNAYTACETCFGGSNYQMAENESVDDDLSEQQIRYLLRDPTRVTRRHPPTDLGGLQPERPHRWLLAETMTANLRRGVPYGLVVHQDAAYKSVPELLRDQAQAGLPGLRRLSVREAAKLQDVPQWYVFEGSVAQQYRQVGNGVAVNVARAVGRHVMRAFGRRIPKDALARRSDSGMWPTGRSNETCIAAYRRLKRNEGVGYGQLEISPDRSRRPGTSD